MAAVSSIRGIVTLFNGDTRNEYALDHPLDEYKLPHHTQ